VPIPVQFYAYTDMLCFIKDFSDYFLLGIHTL